MSRSSVWRASNASPRSSRSSAAFFPAFLSSFAASSLSVSTLRAWRSAFLNAVDATAPPRELAPLADGPVLLAVAPPPRAEGRPPAVLVFEAGWGARRDDRGFGAAPVAGCVTEAGLESPAGGAAGLAADDFCGIWGPVD